MYRDWEDHSKCINTKMCQETGGFKGTEHEGTDVCEDGCIWGKGCWKWKKLKL
jgi:hypothetical protein